MDTGHKWARRNEPTSSPSEGATYGGPPILGFDPMAASRTEAKEGGRSFVGIGAVGG